MKTKSITAALAGALALIVGVVFIGTTAPLQAQAPGGVKPDSAAKTRVASCNCGQLRVTCTGPDPERISMCHCNLCQKQSGSVFAVQTRFPREQVTIEGKSTVWKFPAGAAQPVTFRNCASAGVTFHFCPVCGSTVYYTVNGDDSRIGVKVGTFADPTFPPPVISGFEAYRHSWAMKAADLPIPHVD
jgi:hypothetical protein